MKINWKVRLKNKVFWITIIPMILLLIQQVLGLFGVSFEIEGLTDSLVAIISTIFSILAIIGIIADPTTDGLSDSNQAMTYEVPKKD